MPARLERKIDSTAGPLWVVTNATIISCRRQFLSGGLDETGAPNLPTYIAAFEYEVNGRRYRGKISRGTPVALGHRFEISYDPMNPSRNTGSDYQITWTRVVGWIIGGSPPSSRYICKKGTQFSPQTHGDLRPTHRRPARHRPAERLLPRRRAGRRGGDEIVPLINTLAQKFDHVILTQDWHPAGHISFASAHPGTAALRDHRRALRPPDALAGSLRADTPPAPRSIPRSTIPHAELILRKGFRRDIDSYSAFLENDHFTPTGLAGYLRERGLKRLFLCGLAYDFCVRLSAIDGTALDFECLVIEDATRAVNLPGSVDATDQAFDEAGIQRIQSTDLLTR